MSVVTPRKRRRHGERASGLPEMTIVLGVVLALLFGIIDFGRATYTYAFVGQLARQGARWAIVRGSQCTVLDHCNAQSSDVQTYVRGLTEGVTNPSSISVIATWPACPAGLSGHAPGCTVQVAVSYPFTFILPFMPGANLTQFNMKSTSQMVISQ
jgi:Flp pilus assembly protein TadG